MSKAFVKYRDGTVDNCDYDVATLEAEWVVMTDTRGAIAAMYNLSKIRSVTLLSSKGCINTAFITSSIGVIDNCGFDKYDSDADFIYFYDSNDVLLSFYSTKETRGIRFQLGV